MFGMAFCKKNLDVRQLGLGGASCGPKPEAEYIFPIRREKWSVTFSSVGF